MKNSYKIAVLFTLFISAFAHSQEKLKGNRDVITQNRNISDFSKIEVIDNVTVYLVHSNTQSVSVETDSNLQDAIITEVKDGTLILKIDTKIIRKKALNIHIKVSDKLQKINTYNSAKVVSSNLLIIDSLTVNAFDNSNFDLKLKSKMIHLNAKKNSDLVLQILCENIVINSEELSDVKATINAQKTIINALDKSDLKIIGESNALEIETNGSSSFKGKDFITKNAFVNVSNTSNVSINCIEDLEINAKNSAEVYIFSNPKITLTEFFDKAAIYKK